MQKERKRRKETPAIGIGITTHNRRELLLTTLEKIEMFAPKGAKIVIVDDASETPFEKADYRFEENAGIAAAKNKCFELLAECEHIFLFDDDTYPVKAGWYLPYIESPEAHLAFCFGNPEETPGVESIRKIEEDERHSIWTHQRGCMLYFKKICLEQVGGMDWRFGRWGYEHLNLALRIFNAGLTTYPYMDVKDSGTLFFCEDMKGESEAKRSVPLRIRSAFYQVNKTLFEEERHKVKFIDYRNPFEDKTLFKKGNEIVITSFYAIDAEEEDALEELQRLIKSMQGKARLVILSDVMDITASENHVVVRVAKADTNTIFRRFADARSWLAKNDDIGKVWIVLPKHIEMLNAPFKAMKDGFLHAGDENRCFGAFLMGSISLPEFACEFIKRHPEKVILSPNLFGTNRGLMIRFLSMVMQKWEDNSSYLDSNSHRSMPLYDLMVFNLVAAQFFESHIVYGRKVATVYNRFQNSQGVLSWWKHR